MIRIAWIAGLVLIPQAEDDAGALLQALQDKVQKAKSVRVKVDFAFSERGAPAMAYSGEVRDKGADRWHLDFLTTKGDGLENQFRASCDGKTVGMREFRTRREAREPERYTRQLRDWCATSFLPVFFSLAYQNVDQGENNLPKVSAVKSLGREKLGGVDARVIEYLLEYPTNTQAMIRAWIDPVEVRPLKRQLVSGQLVETITSFEIDPETSDAVFVVPDPTEADPPIARLKQIGGRQIEMFREALNAYQADEGRFPSTAEGLDALLKKPKEAKNWKGPYLEGGEVPKDPWGNAYVYRFPGARDPARYDLASPDFDEKYRLPLEKMKGLLAAEDREREVLAAFKSLANAQADFRSNDRDGNGVADSWVGDVSGLYRYLAGGAEIRLIDRRVAEADVSPLRIKELSKDWPAQPVPFGGYFFAVLSKHAEEDKLKPYHAGGFRNAERFGLVAVPADYPKSARFTLILSENMAVFKRDLGGKPMDTWPADEELKKWRVVRDE